MPSRVCACFSSLRSESSGRATRRGSPLALFRRPLIFGSKESQGSTAEAKCVDSDSGAPVSSSIWSLGGRQALDVELNMHTIYSALGPETAIDPEGVLWGAGTPSMCTIYSALGLETFSWHSAAVQTASMRTLCSVLGPETLCQIKRPQLGNPISLVGVFSNWKYNKTAKLNPWMDQADSWPSHFPELPEGMVRLKKVVRLTSSSFSFQVVCPDKDWDWRLFPRDFKSLMWGVHVSKEGVLTNEQREKVVIGVGNSRKGDGKNLHIVGSAGGGDICTVWMDLPVHINGSLCVLDTHTENQLGVRAPKVWYVVENKANREVQLAVQMSGGDGKDIESYRNMLEANSI